MSIFVVILGMSMARATVPGWNLVSRHDDKDCSPGKFKIVGPKQNFAVRMGVEARDGVTDLRFLEIENLHNRSTDRIRIRGVAGVEGKACFRIYQNPRPGGAGIVDLAVYAYNSAGAGPSFVYLMYSPVRRKFIASETTLPKLIWKNKNRWEAEVKHDAFELRDGRFYGVVRDQSVR